MDGESDRRPVTSPLPGASRWSRVEKRFARPRLGPALFGIGLAGTFDEVVLHQLLHWHHFYDRSTPAAGLVSDGLFHLFSTAMLLIGGRALLEARRREPPVATRRLIGGVLMGAGGFNVYDGTVQHKLLRLHQVRYGVDELPYDVGFVALAVALLLAGLVLVRPRPTRARSASR
jgi:uncharacterized membrane protein